MLGATAVAVLTDFVFRDENDLRYSLSLIGLVTMSLAIASLALGVKPYRESLKRARLWGDEG